MKRTHERKRRPNPYDYIPRNALADCLEREHHVEISTETDHCHWLRCHTCRLDGPKSHSIRKAILRAIISGLREIDR